MNRPGPMAYHPKPRARKLTPGQAAELLARHARGGVTREALALDYDISLSSVDRAEGQDLPGGTAMIDAPATCIPLPGGGVRRRCAEGQRLWDRYVVRVETNPGRDAEWAPAWKAYEAHLAACAGGQDG